MHLEAEKSGHWILVYNYPQSAEISQGYFENPSNTHCCVLVFFFLLLSFASRMPKDYKNIKDEAGGKTSKWSVWFCLFFLFPVPIVRYFLWTRNLDKML